MVWILESSVTHQEEWSDLMSEFCTIKFFSNFEKFRLAYENLIKSNKTKTPLFVSDAIVKEGLVVDLLKRLQVKTPPWIVITNCHSSDVIRSCFEFGVEDYLLKPVNWELIQAKLKHKLRLYQSDDMRQRLRLSVHPRMLSVKDAQGCMIGLTLKEFQLFTLLYEAYPQSQTREELIHAIWGETQVVQKTFDVHLFKLRKKLLLIGLQVQLIAGMKYILACPEINLSKGESKLKK